jgi:hypothetical protein
VKTASVMLAVAVAGVMDAAALLAQANDANAPVLRGIVVDTAGLPIPNVHVQRKGKRGGVMSNDQGRFSIEVEPKQKLQVELRRIGMHPARYVAPLPPDTIVTLVMYSMPQTLPGVEVTAARSVNLERVGFYSRLNDNQKGSLSGYFLTPEYLAKRNGQRITQLVENVPGVEVRVGIPGVDSPMLRGLNNCVMNVWLQGVNLRPDSGKVVSQRIRLERSKIAGNNLGPDGQLPISNPYNMQIDQIIQGSSVAAIEVYPRQSQVPDRFRTLHSDCGAVVIWLKGAGDK